ncbi:MAG: tetratricopeptide repeat protein [Leptospirales bacterium]|nr:tetratricopeptide repeat protein [Leptospirales bacterium]
MNKLYKLSVIVIAVLITSCAGSPSSIESKELLSLDKAIGSAVAAVEAKVAGGTEIAVYKIVASHDKIGDYMGENLNDRFALSGKLKPLARGEALRAVLKEQELQMLGIVTDKSAAEVGSLLSAKVVITGTFDRYAGFSQLRIRAVDAQTSAMLTAYEVRISNSDSVLAGIVAPFGSAPEKYVSEEALACLNRGKDFYAAGSFDNAIREFGRAIALAPDFAEAYFYRGVAYDDKKDYDRAISDYNNAIRLDPDYAYAYYNRGIAYRKKGDYDRAIADYTQAIRLDPNYAYAYNNRGNAYSDKKDYDRAIADYTQAIKIDPNLAVAYNNRGIAYRKKGDYDRAIADYTQAIKIDPNYADAYNNRGIAYYGKRNYDRAISDYESALRINPNVPNAKNNLEMAKRAKAEKR